jgi:hypothetical protein
LKLDTAIMTPEIVAMSQESKTEELKQFINEQKPQSPHINPRI